MPHYNQPVWAERQPPTLQITDLTLTQEYQDVFWTLGPAGQHHDYLNWVNANRWPLQQELLLNPSIAEERLAGRGIALAALATTIGEITHSPPYPLHRVRLNSLMQINEAYIAGLTELTPELGFDAEDDIDAQINPLLGVALLNEQFVRDAGADSVGYRTAGLLAQAALSSTVNVLVQYDPEPMSRWWYGYQWWQNDERYGGVLHIAAIEKAATLARRELGLVTPGLRRAHPLATPYQLEEGFYYESGAAVLLDIVNQKAGFGADGRYGVYELIWQFGQEGGNEDTRDALADIVRIATSGQISLEDLEALPVYKEGMPLGTMRRVEQACDLDYSQQPSRYFERLGIQSTD